MIFETRAEYVGSRSKPLVDLADASEDSADAHTDPSESDEEPALADFLPGLSFARSSYEEDPGSW